MKEVYKIWKDTTNPNGFGRSKGSLWEVSNMGHVRKNGVNVECYVGKQGYVYLSGGDLLHRAVATLFIDNPENKPQIDHIDGNKQNNRVDNLRWVNAQENMLNPNTNPTLHKKHNKMCIEGRIKMSKRCTGCKWMNDGDNEYFVAPNDIYDKLQKGLVLGRLRGFSKIA